MSIVTFDTLQFAKRLEAGGFDSQQAEVLVEAQKDLMSEALDSQQATKADIVRVEKKLISHDGRLNLLQWMVGFNLAFTMAMLWKVFS